MVQVEEESEARTVMLVKLWFENYSLWEHKIVLLEQWVENFQHGLPVCLAKFHIDNGQMVWKADEEGVSTDGFDSEYDWALDGPMAIHTLAKLIEESK